MGDSLSKKDQVFINEYLTSFNATDAYLKTHPKSTRESANANSSRLIATDKIGDAIRERLNGAHMSAEEALKLLADMARGDIGQFTDRLGQLDLQAAKDEGRSKLIKKIKQKTVTKIGKKDDDEDVEIHDVEIELYDAQAAIDKILRVHGRYEDKLKITADVRQEIGIKEIDYRAGITKTEE